MFERESPTTPPAATTAPTSTTTTTTTTTSTSAAAASSAATSSAATLIGTGTSLVHVHLTALQLLAVQVVDRGLGFFLGGHLHERESPGLAAKLVRDDVHGRDLPEGFEGFPQIAFGDVARQVSYVDIHSGAFSS
jgi:hypothetical protein